LYPLPGVDALLAQAEQMGSNSNASSTSPPPRAEASSSSTTTRPAATARQASTASTASSTGADGRAYTPEQVAIVEKVLKAKEGGRGAHYRVLGISENANENDIKKAYRKLALKLHPDKNSAPHADEAFKAVGLAYATLSDSQKRTIYDHSGEEDPDNRAGGMRPGTAHFRGQEVSPEEIFNMFFGGGMGGMPGGGVHMRGPGGMHFYSSGFGPGMGRAGRGRPRAAPGQGQQRQAEPEFGFGNLLQMLPFFLIMILSFYNMAGDGGSSMSRGEGTYFSLTVSLLVFERLSGFVDCMPHIIS
jgi:DnaJ homolog subfamily B member 12